MDKTDDTEYALVPRLPGYKERAAAQLENWVAGKPEHNDIDGECCPDFSCCAPQLLSPIEQRQAFLRASQADDQKTMSAFLGGFLGRAFAGVHVVGDGAKSAD